MVKTKKLNSQTKETISNQIFKSKALVDKYHKSRRVKRELGKCIEKDIDDLKFEQKQSNDLTEIKPEIIQKALKGVLKFHSENPKLKNQLFEEKFPIFLQITCFKVPKGHSKIFRIPLKHSLYNVESEICLIVSEIKGIPNSEYDQHKEHYEKLLSDKGVENIKNIMTFREFRTDYETFEQKNRLVDLYDVFLADSKVSGKVVKKCGKIFYKKRKVPISVKLQMSKLKEHIDKTLLKTYFHLHLQGNSYTVQVGHSKLTLKQLENNIQCVKFFLENEFPGGFDNVLGINIFAPRVSSIPVYCSINSGKDIEVPKIASKKPKAFKTYTGELTTLPNADVIVKPSGKVIVKRTKHEENEASHDVKKANTGHIQGSNKFGNSKKIKKRKPEKSTELQKHKQTHNSTKRKNMVLTIESGKIEEEIVLDGVQLGDNEGDKVKRRRVTTDGLKGLKIKSLKEKYKVGSELKSEGSKIKKQIKIKSG